MYAVVVPKIAINENIYGQDTVVSSVNENGNFIESYDFIKDKIVKSNNPYLNTRGDSHNQNPMTSVIPWNGSVTHMTFDTQTAAIVWKAQAIEFVNKKVLSDLEEKIERVRKNAEKMQKSIDKIKMKCPEYFI